MSFAAVLPLAIRGSYDIDDLGRARLLLQSLEQFAAPDLFESFLVVMPGAQIPRVRAELEAFDALRVRVVDENDVVPSLPRHPHVRGWRKQQLVKLGAARWLDVDHYLTFDADILALRPFDGEDLVREGRAVTQYCRLDEHPKWWKSSARVLDFPVDEFWPSGVGLHATPALLSRQICLRLMDTLCVGSVPGTEPPDAPWDEQLLRLHGGLRLTPRGIVRWRMRKWTEYSLYYLFALQAGLWHEHHLPAAWRDDGRLDTPLFWYLPNESFCRKRLAEMYRAPDRPPFAVVGTKGVLEPETVAGALEEALEEALELSPA